MIEGSFVKLTRIVSNHKKLRTDEVIGIVMQSPVVGYQFILIAESLNLNKQCRHVQTSHIQSIEIKDGVWYLKTLNSEYKLEKLI
jgi:hypothetical protein